MTIHADEPSFSFSLYNSSIITTIIVSLDRAARATGDPNRTQLSCWAHKHGVRVVYMGFNEIGPTAESPFDHALNHSALLHDHVYRQQWLDAGLEWAQKYPWIDGVQIDLERFKAPYEPRLLTGAVCAAQKKLSANGIRLHSQDLAVEGTYGDWNVSALAGCLDFILGMGYCNPASTTIAGPTIRLDHLTSYFRGAGSSSGGWAGVSPAKIILGLPFFGYVFPCVDEVQSPSPTDNPGDAPSCALAQPPSFNMIDYVNVMEIYRSQNITKPLGGAMGFDAIKGSAWFEYRNRTTGQRHQAWFESPAATHAKSKFAFESGLHGVAFWRGNELFGRNVP